jgi:succinyl-CoA synthetase alpha subunit
LHIAFSERRAVIGQVLLATDQQDRAARVALADKVVDGVIGLSVDVGKGGVLVPGVGKVGTLSNEYVLKGDVGVIARTRGNEKKLCQSLYKEEIGESVIVSLGGDDIIGTGFTEILELFEEDEKTQIVVIGGENTGRLEEDAARFIQEQAFSKPVIAYIFDKEKNPTTAAEKERMFREAGVTVVEDIWEIGQIIKEATVEE